MGASVTSFRGWGQSWLDSWGPVSVDPNAMQGSASFSFTASLQVNSGEMQGSASFRIDAVLGAGEPKVAGGYDDERKKAKKRFIVEKNGKLMVFNTAQAALDAQPKKKKVQPVEVDVPEQVAEVIELPAVKEYAQVIGQIEQYNSAYNSQHFEKLIALFEQMRDEEDVELLLLA